MLTLKILFQGNVLKERERARSESDWKQIITKKVVDTGEALKKHANKVTDRIQKWWKGKKASLKRKNSKSSKPEL